MKSPSIICLVVALTALCAIGGLAGSGTDGPPPGPPPGMPPGPPPIIAALDANKDQKIDAAEIANAPAALLTLDRNADGVLTRDELRPPPPPPPPGAPADAAGPDGSVPPPPPPGDDGNRPGPPPPGMMGPGGPGGHGKCPMPLFAVLDANADGTIDAVEIKNAPAALLKLDKNGDGVLTPDEFAPRPPKGGPDGACCKGRCPAK